MPFFKNLISNQNTKALVNGFQYGAKVSTLCMSPFLLGSLGMKVTGQHLELPNKTANQIAFDALSVILGYGLFKGIKSLNHSATHPNYPSKLLPEITMLLMKAPYKGMPLIGLYLFNNALFYYVGSTFFESSSEQDNPRLASRT